MKISKWLSDIFEPQEFNNLDLDAILVSMNDATIRKHWLRSVLDEIRDANMRTHCALVNGDLNTKFIQESARLQGIDWVMRQILNSKTSVELDRHHNRSDNPHEGVTVEPIR